MKRTQLNIHVQGLNLLNTYTTEFVPKVLEALTGLIGAKIFLANGDKSKKLVAIALPTRTKGLDIFTDTFVDYSFYLTESYGSLQMRISLCINGGSYDVKPTTAFTQYFDKTVHLGDIKDGVLQSLVSVEDAAKNSGLDTRFDEASILASAETYNIAAEELDKLKNKVPHQVRHLLGIK